MMGSGEAGEDEWQRGRIRESGNCPNNQSKFSSKALLVTRQEEMHSGDDLDLRGPIW